MSKVIVIAPAEIAKGDPQKISANLKKFNQAEAMTELAIESLKKFDQIENEEQKENALTTLKEAAAVSKAIEARRVQLVKPFNDSVKAINEFAKGLCARIDNKVDSNKKVVLAWQKAEEERKLQERTDARIKVLADLGFSEAQNIYSRQDVGAMSLMEVKSYDDKSFTGIISRFTEKINELATKAAEVQEESDELNDIFGADDAIESAPVQQATAPAPVTAPVYNGTSFSTGGLKGVTKRWTYAVTDINEVPREYLVIDPAIVRKAIADGTRTIPGLRIYQDESLTLR